jgi:hypothetical protein
MYMAGPVETGETDRAEDSPNASVKKKHILLYYIV